MRPHSAKRFLGKVSGGRPRPRWRRHYDIVDDRLHYPRRIAGIRISGTQPKEPPEHKCSFAKGACFRAEAGRSEVH